MPELHAVIVRHGDPPPFRHTHGTPIIQAADAPLRMAIIEGGMTSGAPSVAFEIPLPQPDGPQIIGADRPVLLAETSLGMFVHALAIARGAFPESFAGGPFAIPESGPGGLSPDGVFEFADRENLDLVGAINQALAAAVGSILIQGQKDGDVVRPTWTIDNHALSAISAALFTFVQEYTF